MARPPALHTAAAGITLSLAVTGAIATPPVLIEIQTGDETFNAEAVRGFDISPVFGDQRAFGITESGSVWASVDLQGAGDPEPVQSVVFTVTVDSFLRTAATDYDSMLGNGQTLIRFTPRCLGANGKLYSEALILDENSVDEDSTVNSVVILDAIGIPARVFDASDLLTGSQSFGSTTRVSLTRVTPDGGFLVQHDSRSFWWDYAIPFIAGDFSTTLPVTNASFSSPFGYIYNYFPESAFYNSQSGLTLGASTGGPRALRLTPPFTEGAEQILFTSDTPFPAVFGGTIVVEEMNVDFEFSNADSYAIFSSVDQTEGLLIGNFIAGFEFHPLGDLTSNEVPEILALAPDASAVYAAQVLEEYRAVDNIWLSRPGFPLRLLATLGSPLPGLPDDLLVTRAHWFKVSNAGAVLMALRFSPDGDAAAAAAAFDAIVARYPDGLFEILAQEGQPIPGDAAAMGIVTSIDTTSVGAPSEHTLSDAGKGVFAVRFESGDEAILSVELGFGGCSPADLTSDSFLDNDDVLAFLLLFADQSPQADFDADSDIDFDDVLAFLQAFTLGCP